MISYTPKIPDTDRATAAQLPGGSDDFLGRAVLVGAEAMPARARL